MGDFDTQIQCEEVYYTEYFVEWDLQGYEKCDTIPYTDFVNEDIPF